MEIILTIVGLFGIPSLYFGIRYLFFKHNVEFHKILNSFPIISENRINNGTKTTTDIFTNIEISKEFTEFVETKRGELDEFLAKLEIFDSSKLMFKKKEIISFINNTKRLLTSKANTNGKSFEWSAFNYIIVYKIIKEQKNINKLFVYKILNF